MSINFAQLLGQTISFEVYPSSILGTKFNSCIVRGISDYSGVTSFDPAVMHANVFPTIPSSNATPDDFRKYMYLRLELANNVITFVGIPWINESTLITVSNRNLEVIIPNHGSVEKQEFIKRILLNNGIQDFTVKPI